MPSACRDFQDCPILQPAYETPQVARWTSAAGGRSHYKRARVTQTGCERWHGWAARIARELPHRLASVSGRVVGFAYLIIVPTSHGSFVGIVTSRPTANLRSCRSHSWMRGGAEIKIRRGKICTQGTVYVICGLCRCGRSSLPFPIEIQSM